MTPKVDPPGGAPPPPAAPPEARWGFVRSLAASAAVLGLPALGALLLGRFQAGPVLGAAWRLIVFPHPGFMASGGFPGRPAPLLSLPMAVLAAGLQWGLAGLGLAWLVRRKRLRTQVALSVLVVVGLGLAVAAGALALGVSLRLE